MTNSNPEKSFLYPLVSIECVVVGFDGWNLNLLTEKKSFLGKVSFEDSAYALPGKMVQGGEALEDQARSLMIDLTGQKDPFVEQFHVFGDLAPRKFAGNKSFPFMKEDFSGVQVISVAYYCLASMDTFGKKGDFPGNVSWTPIHQLPELEYGHTSIQEKAMASIRQKLYMQPVACLGMLPKKFTMLQLHRLYETILGKQLDKRNFRRKFMNMGVLLMLEEKTKGNANKPSQLYKVNRKKFRELNRREPVFAI